MIRPIRPDTVLAQVTTHRSSAVIVRSPRPLRVRVDDLRQRSSRDETHTELGLALHVERERHVRPEPLASACEHVLRG